MGILPLDKSWQKNVNQVMRAEPDANGMRRGIMARIVKTMVEFATNPWTVKVCCYWNGSAWAVDTSGTNQWIDQYDLGWGTTDRSWIVLHNGALNYDILLDCYGAAGNTAYITMKWSPGAMFPASGTSSSPPTAADSITVMNNVLWCEYSAPLDYIKQTIVHVVHSTDGMHTRAVAYGGGARATAWFFEAIDEVQGSWTYPYVIWNGMYNGRALSQALLGHTNNYWTGRYGSTTFGAACTFETCWDWNGYSYPLTSAGDGNAVRDFANYPLQKCGLWSNTTNVRGRIGKLIDFWAASSGLSTNELFTESSSEFAILGSVVFPWDGSGVLKTC